MTHLPNLHCLTIPTPFSVGDVNIYLFEPGAPGEQLSLFDAGPHWEPAERAVREGFAALGYRVSDLEQILISHAHPDHYGLAAALASESAAKVLAHPYGFPILRPDRSSTERTHAFYQDWFTRSGVPLSVQEGISNAQSGTHHFAQPVQPDGSLRDGDRLHLGGLDWEVLATPGHSGGMICLYQPGSSTLLASDHLIDEISSNPVVEPPPAGMTERPKRLLQYLQQLERVSALRPTIAYSGHGRPIRDVAGLVQRRIAFHHRRAEQVLRQLAEQPMSLFELASQLFGDALPPVHQFLALSEIQGHLDLLEASGQAEYQSDGAIGRWVATGPP
jgi:glyoxylase-like metal-dependent hydrolase (beta-lactamase superfamily II)